MSQLADLADQTSSDQPKAADTPVRRAVAVVVARFPRIDETFILREITELERLGQPVLVVPLLRDRSTVVHDEARPWDDRALHLPLISIAIAVSNVRALIRHPLRYLGLLLRLIAGTALHPGTLIRTLALFPKSVHLARLLPSFGIRHIHSYLATHATTIAYVVSSLSSITYSFSVQGPDVFVHRALLREKIRRATFVRTISVFNKAFLSGLYPDQTEGKIEVVHNGLASQLYRASSRVPTQRPGPWKVLTASAFSPSRGVGFLVDAIALLRREGLDIECHVIGAEPVRGLAEERILQNGVADAIHLHGPQPQREVTRLMAECDIFALPSIVALNGQMDGIPISLMEAMASGKPVIASAISGIPELVRHDQNGILVDFTHVERIADAIRTLVEHPSLMTRLGEAARQTISTSFDVSATASRLVSLIDRHERTNDVSPSTASRILALDWARLQVCALGIRKIRTAGHSSVAEVTISNGITSRDVIVRRQRMEPDEAGLVRERARREFEILSVLRQSLGTSAFDETSGTIYSVPRVLMFDESNAAIVVERADGVSLARLIREVRMRGRVGRLALGLRRAGRWLNLMQSHARPDVEGSGVLAKVVEIARTDLDLACSYDAWLRRNRSAIESTLRLLEQRLIDSSLEIVGHHGDYSPENIFIGARRVDVVDFESWRDGLAVEDVAHMLLHLEIGLGWPLLRHLYPVLRKPFIDGWRGSRPSSFTPQEMQLATITRALHLLAAAGGQCEGFEAWRRRRILHRAIARNLEA
jgi:colanic acid/amylovoran biosynthesis glycosyltransferase